MPEMKKCKECGKLFMPKGREQYCSDVHYRPCPVCGKPVIAKYLSDPARRCDDCKHSKKVEPKKETQPKSHKSVKLFNIDVDNEPKKKAADTEFKAEPFKLIIPDKAEKESPMQTVDTEELLSKVELIASNTLDQSIFCETMSNTVKTYIGNSHGESYFIPGHEYLIHVEHNGYTYRIIATEDVTADETVKIVTDYASQISFRQNFAIAKKFA